jgi:hypothetical protein
LVGDLDEDCINVAFDARKRLVNFFLKAIEFFDQFPLGFLDGLLQFNRVDVHGSQLREVLLGAVDDYFKGLDFVIFMHFFIADPTNYTVLYALGLNTHQVQNLTHMVASFSTLRVSEVFVLCCP